jgi:MtrB/PioB family decaheme-associated outer membrane protein
MNARLHRGWLGSRPRSRIVLLAPLLFSQAVVAQKAADADNPDVTALTQPTNFVQLGGEVATQDSDKFGEYNGLYNKGPNAIGDFSLAGGSGYGADTGTMRYKVFGTDVGTTSTTIGAAAADEGVWNLGASFDDLRHQLTRSYQTPFDGSVGGNNFNLPFDFGVIDTAHKPAGFKTAPGTNQLTATQLGDFHPDDIHSDRKNASLTAGHTLSNSLDVQVSYNHLFQTGAKLLGVAGDQVNTPTGSAYTWAGQTPLVIPNPTDSGTDTIKLALNWAGTRGWATAGYYGSIYSDHYSSVSWNNPFVKAPASVATGTLSAFPVDTISTFPSNIFNQLNLTGGYVFGPSTRLVAGASYGISEQNAAFPQTGNIGLTPLGLPGSSLNGYVAIEHFDVKLTDQSWRPLTVSAGFKFDERNNETRSNAYVFNTINEPANQTETSVNAPMSNKKLQTALSGDLRVSSRQHLSLGYEYVDTRRWCNNALANNQQGSLDGATTGGWTAYTAATCAQVPDTRENKLTAGYRLHAADDLNFRASYQYSDRKADLSPSFYNPMQAVDNPAGAGAGAEGYEVLGFVSFFEASRHEQIAKAGADWQPGEKLSMSLSGRYTKDVYTDLMYGVQNSNAGSANFDTSYVFNSRREISFYATHQSTNRNLTNLYKVLASKPSATGLSGFAGETWTNKMKENDNTFGIAGKQDGVWHGRVDLKADASYSLGGSTYSTSPFAGADLEGNTCSAAYYETCGTLPTIRNNTLRVRLTSAYNFQRAGTAFLGYTYQRLTSDDFIYNAYQYGSTPATLLPTNQQSPSYNLSAIYLAYRYTFR